MLPVLWFCRPLLHLEHIQPVRNLLITLQEKLATPAGQQVAQTLQQTGDTRELLDILTDDGWLKNEYHGEEEIFTGLASLNDLVRLAAAMGTEFPFDEYAEVQKLPVIDVEFSHLVGMDACQGTLTLLDNRVCQVLTCLPEKFVVDFANGIDVAQEHIRTAGERTFFRRLKEGLTGEGAARQNAINALLAQGVEASLRWLTEMTTSLATTNYAITEIDGMNCQTKNQFNYKDNSYVFVLERGGAWCYDYTVSVVNLKTGKAQMIEYGDNQLCSGSNKPFFEIKNGVPTVGVIDTSGKPVVVAQDKLKI